MNPTVRKALGYILSLLLWTFVALASPPLQPRIVSPGIGERVFGFPVELRWEYGANVLTNGGFELGQMPPWTTQPRSGAGWVIVRANAVAEGVLCAQSRFPARKAEESLIQTLQVPDTADTWQLQWQERFNGSPSFVNPTAAGERWSVLISTNNQPVPQLVHQREFPPGRVQEDWKLRTFDLTPWRGQSVRIAFVTTGGTNSTSRLLVNLDAVALKPSPAPGTTYDVYVGQTMNFPPETLTGRTNQLNFKLGSLKQDTDYFAKVVARNPEGEAHSEVVPFRTYFLTFDFAIDAQFAPRDLIKGQPIPLSLVLVDKNHAVQEVDSDRVVARVDGVRPRNAGIVIAGFHEGFVQLINVGDKAVSLRGHRLVGYHVSRTSIASSIDLSSIHELVPAASLVLVNDAATAEVWKQRLPAGSSILVDSLLERQCLLSGLALRDGLGEIVDFVVIRSFLGEDRLPGDSWNDSQWSGEALTFETGCPAFRRKSATDSNTRADWEPWPVAALNTPVALGAAPQLGSTALGGVFSPPLQFRAGRWRGTLLLDAAAQDVALSIEVDRERMMGERRVTLGTIREFSRELQLLSRAGLREGEGRITNAFEIRLGEPAAEEIEVRFDTDPPAFLDIPRFRLAKGATNGFAEALVMDDAEYNSTRSVVVRARAEGFEPAIRTVEIANDDPPGLEVSIADPIMEGQSATVLLTLRAPAIADTTVTYSIQGNAFVQGAANNGDYVVILPKGSREVSVPIAVVDDNNLGAPASFQFSATVAGWPTVVVTRNPVSNDVPNPQFELLGYYTDGDSRLGAKFRIGFGGGLDHAIQTTLSSSDEAILKLPAEISVTGFGVVFEALLGKTDNPKKSRTTLLRAEAPGYPPVELRLEVPALSPSRIEVSLPEGSARWKTDANVRIRAFDVDGKPWQNVVNAPGTVGLYSRENQLLHSGLVPLPPDIRDAVQTIRLEYDAEEFRAVVSVGGVEGASEWFPISVQRSRRLPLHVGDAVRAGTGPNVIASVLSTSPQHANEIVFIEAASGQIQTLVPFPVGDVRESIQLASSTDGSVFLVLDKVQEVARLFRQSDGHALWEASVTDVLMGPSVIWDAVLLRESPWTLAIRTAGSKSVLVSTNGLSRPPGFDFVPYGSSRNGRFVARLILEEGPATGLLELGQGTELIYRRLPTSGPEILLNNSVLFLPDGHQIRFTHEFKEDTHQGVREWPLYGFQFSSLDQRGLYRLWQQPFEFQRRLSGVDFDSGLEYFSVSTADILSDPWKFVDCGSNRVAFATDSEFGFLDLPQNPRVAPGKPVGGTLTLSPGSRSGAECVWEARLTNQTETVQESLRLEVHLPVGFKLMETNATDVAQWIDGAWQVTRWVPTLAAHETMAWEIRSVPNVVGPVHAQLGLGTLDADGTRVTLWTEGIGAVSPGDLIGNAVSLTDIGALTAVDLPGNRLFTVTNKRIVGVDLATMEHQTLRENVYDVSALKLDASGRFLYAIQDGGASIVRIDVQQSTPDLIQFAEGGWRWVAIEPDPNNPRRFYAARSLEPAPFKRSQIAMDLVEDMIPKVPGLNLQDSLSPTVQFLSLQDRDAVSVLVQGDNSRLLEIEQNQGSLKLGHQRALPYSPGHWFDSGSGWLLFNGEWVLEDHLQRGDLTILPKMPGFLKEPRLAQSAAQDSLGHYWITVRNSGAEGDAALVFERWDITSGVLLSQTRLEKPEEKKPGVVVLIQESGRVLWRSESGIAMTDIGPMERQNGVDLKVRVKNPEATFVIGQSVAVDVVVENQGASRVAESVVVIGSDPELLPTHVEWIEGSSGGVWNGGNTIELGGIEPGGARQLRVHFAPSTMAEYLLHWNVSSPGLESTPRDNNDVSHLKSQALQGLLAHSLRLPFTAFCLHPTSHHLFAADGEFIREIDPNSQQVVRSFLLPESVSKLVVSAAENVLYALTSNRVELLQLDLSSGTVRSIVRKEPYAPTAILDFCTIPGQLGSLVISETGMNPVTYVVNPDGNRRPNEIYLPLNPSVFESGTQGRAGVFDQAQGRCSDRLLEFALSPAGLTVTQDFLSGGCATTWIGDQPVVEPSALDLRGDFLWKVEYPEASGSRPALLKTVRVEGRVELHSFPSVVGEGLNGMISHAERSVSFIHERQLGMVSFRTLPVQAAPPTLVLETEKMFLQMGTVAPVTVRITNTGSVSLDSVEAVVDWPLPIVSHSSGPGRVAVDPLVFGKARWLVGTLEAGKSVEMEFEVLVGSEIAVPFVCSVVSANAEATTRSLLLQVAPSDAPGSQVGPRIGDISKLALSPRTQRVYALGTGGFYEFDGRTGLPLRGPLSLNGMEPSDCVFDTTESRALVIQRASDTSRPALVVDLEAWKVIRQLMPDPDKVFVGGIAVPDHPQMFWLIAQNSFSGGGAIFEVSDTETKLQPIPPIAGFSRFLGTSDRGVLVLETSPFRDNYRVMEVSSIGGVATVSRVWDHAPVDLIAANRSELLGSDGSVYTWGQSVPQRTLPGASALHPFGLFQGDSRAGYWMLARFEGARNLYNFHIYDGDWTHHMRAVSYNQFATRDALVTESDLLFLATPALFITRLGAPPDEGLGVVDQDADGLPDAWENRYQLNPLDPTDAAKDADEDGYTNAQELYLGTNPRDPQSGLSIQVERLDSNQVQFGFHASGLRLYRIESRGLEEGDEWIPISAEFQRAEGPVKFTLQMDAAAALWRVVAR